MSEAAKLYGFQLGFNSGCKQVVSGGFWVFKSFQKPPVAGYWY